MEEVKTKKMTKLLKLPQLVSNTVEEEVASLCVQVNCQVLHKYTIELVGTPDKAA